MLAIPETHFPSTVAWHGEDAGMRAESQKAISLAASTVHKNQWRYLCA
jgi:hypothetical protein